MLKIVDFEACYASHARDHPTTAVYESSPKARNKLTPRYLPGERLALRGAAKFASRLPAAGRKDKSVFEFRWVTSEQGISSITNTISNQGGPRTRRHSYTSRYRYLATRAHQFAHTRVYMHIHGIYISHGEWR